jgi:aspartate/methionine/tyrosine aminotransferase
VLENCHVLVYPGVQYGAQFDDLFRITFLQPKKSSQMLKTDGVIFKKNDYQTE